MSLPYAILGFLSYRPMTGYDLGNFFKQSVAHFWHAELSQIYRELGKLEERGLVKSEIQPQESRPDRKIYTLTPAGQKAFGDWLQQPAPTAMGQKEPFLLWLFFAAVVDPKEVVYQMMRFKKDHESKLAEYLEMDAGFELQEKSPDMAEPNCVSGQPGDQRNDIFFQRATLRMGIAFEKATIAWAEEILKDLEARRNKSQK